MLEHQAETHDLLTEPTTRRGRVRRGGDEPRPRPARRWRSESTTARIESAGEASCGRCCSSTSRSWPARSEGTSSFADDFESPARATPWAAPPRAGPQAPAVPVPLQLPDYSESSTRCRPRSKATSTSACGRCHQRRRRGRRLLRPQAQPAPPSARSSRDQARPAPLLEARRLTPRAPYRHRLFVREKAEAGFEPANNGFAIRPLSPLGYSAVQAEH